MNKIIFLLLLILNAQAKTLILIGGGARPAKALAYFVNAIDLNKNILILPWGTRYPNESFESIREELVAVGAKYNQVVCLCKHGFTAKDLDLLQKTGGIYFPGGDQNKIMKKVLKYNLKPLIHRLYNQGIPVAGTSAGTAIQSNPMITDSRGSTSEGLGLLKGHIVDQHFHKREREFRLLQALKNHPGFSGIGIDEDMSLVIKFDKEIIAIGPSLVSLYIFTDNMQKIDLINGMTFQLKK
jgi:cyanophycinase